MSDPVSAPSAAVSVPAPSVDESGLVRKDTGSPLHQGQAKFAKSIRQHPSVCVPIEDEKWTQDHKPHVEETETKLPGSTQSPASLSPNMPAHRIRRDPTDVRPSTSLTEEEIQQIEDEHTVEYSRTLTCNAPKALLWRHLIRKIRHPELYTNARRVNILCEGPDYVYRDVFIAPSSSCTEEDLVVVREKVTWSEDEEEVRFSLYEDEIKSGYIENNITLDASGQVCLTVSCMWTFHPHAEMTPDLLQRWKCKLRTGIDNGCVKTVRIVEEEAKQQLQERRRKSLSEQQSMHEQHDLEKAVKEASISGKAPQKHDV